MKYRGIVLMVTFLTGISSSGRQVIKFLTFKSHQLIAILASNQ
jgi:hypothetical protein